MAGALAGALVAFCVTAVGVGIGESLAFMIFIFMINSVALFPLLVLAGLLLIVMRRRAPGLLANRPVAIALVGVAAALAQGGLIFTIATVAPLGHGNGLLEFRNLLGAAGALSGLVMGGMMAMSASSAIRSTSPAAGFEEAA
ncbi:MAG: hypothetical protein ABIR47_04810 [Candidatus Kapaibacterium sp.]